MKKYGVLTNAKFPAKIESTTLPKNIIRKLYSADNENKSLKEIKEDFIMTLDEIEKNFTDLTEPFWFDVPTGNTLADLLISIENKEISIQQDYPPYGFITLCFSDDLIFLIIENKKSIANIRFLVEVCTKETKRRMEENILVEMFLDVIKIEEI